MRRLSAEVPGASAVRYLSFIAAADALAALDRAAPNLGVQISADGLRRSARMLAPAVREDPLTYDLSVDPELRELFGFDLPISLPEKSAGARFPIVAAAWAADIDRSGLARLKDWVPEHHELDTYLPLVLRLLQEVADASHRAGKIEAAFQNVYRWLVSCTAWQESCWRQFVKRDGQIVPIESPIGSVGLMQVNQRVWRGFYDLQALRRDIGYNRRAGSEILAHYLVDYAIARGEHEKTGSIDNLARATCAAYNGGPGQLTRCRDPNTKKFLRKIDERFWEKYSAVRAGDELAVVHCFGRS